MQGWMIALIVIAAVIVVVALSFVIGALVFVHNVVGRRKAKDSESIPEKYGVDEEWFDDWEYCTQKISITAYDGCKLAGTLIKQPEGQPRLVAICCHGYGSCYRALQPQAEMFFDRGFDVFLPTMRGHEGSEGKVGMAWIDRFDLLRWIDKIIAMYGETVEIALYGISMGGSTVIAAAGMEPPPQVKCVIDDCGFSSQYDQCRASLKNAGLPQCFIHLYNTGLKLVHGYSLYDADIMPFAAKMSVPALFFHGEKDKFVPFALGQKLFDACSSANKKFVAVADAEHACSYIRDRETYGREFTEFIAANFPDSKFIDRPKKPKTASVTDESSETGEQKEKIEQTAAAEDNTDVAVPSTVSEKECDGVSPQTDGSSDTGSPAQGEPEQKE